MLKTTEYLIRCQIFYALRLCTFLIVHFPSSYTIRHQSIRQLVTDKINRQEETLTRLIAQRQSAIDDHSSGRKLLTDEGLEYHKNHISSLRRKLAVTKQKDPTVS